MGLRGPKVGQAFVCCLVCKKVIPVGPRVIVQMAESGSNRKLRNGRRRLASMHEVCWEGIDAALTD